MRNENNRGYIQDKFKHLNLKNIYRMKIHSLAMKSGFIMRNKIKEKHYNTRQNLGLKIIH